MTINEANMAFAVVSAANGHVHCDKPDFPSRYSIGYKDGSQCSSSSFSKMDTVQTIVQDGLLVWIYYTLR
jgi:hypothetical protein